MEIKKEDAECYIHQKYIGPIKQMHLDSLHNEEIEQQIDSLWGVLGVLRNFGVLSISECQSILRQVGSRHEAINL